MGGVHMSTADISLFITAIGAMGTAVTIMWKHQNEQVAKIELRFAEQSKRCEEENVKLKETMVNLLQTLADVKEELGFLKGLVKRNEDKAQQRLTAVKKIGSQ